MKTHQLLRCAVFIGLTILFAQLSTGFAQSPAFTYQGRLDASGGPFTGTAEFQPTLCTAASGGPEVANSPATLLVSVTNGLFVLPLDFGSSTFTAGADRWLQIQVRTAIGPFTTLTPRQKLTATPYAIQAANAVTATTAASANSVAASNITGTLGLAQLPFAVVTNTQSGLSLTGAFTGNGGGLSNLSPASLVFTGTNISIASWGWNDYGQRTIPAGLDDVVAAAGGTAHSLALRANGTVVAWGAGTTNDPASGTHYGQSIVPPGLNSVVAISAGYVHSLALKADRTIAAWGWNDYGQINVPPGLNNVAAISAGYQHNLALKADGTVVAWGTNDHGQLNVPVGLNGVRAVGAGYYHSLVLKSNGTVVVWGSNEFGVTNVPLGLNNVIAVSAGATLNMALKADGTVVVWGTNDFGQLNIPPGLNNVVAISAGLQQCAALKADGTVVAWGHNQFGEATVPPGLNNVVAMVPCFGYHYLVLRKRSQAPVAWLDSDNTFNGSIQVNGDVRVSGEMSAGGGLRMADANLWLRGGGDVKNGLGWYGAGKQFGNGTPSGPVLFGDGGGALGTFGTNGYKVALTWDTTAHIGIGASPSPDAVLSLGISPAATTLYFPSAGYGIGASNSQFRFHLNGSDRFSFLSSPTGTELFTISSFNGFVGIGTPSPTTKLEVRGHIKLGISGEFFAPGSPENLRIIRGIVSNTGTIVAGTGYTVTRTAVGAYTVTFTTAFADLPTITATVQAGLSRVITSTSGTISSVQFRVFATGAETAQDQQFHFIAIGPR